MSEFWIFFEKGLRHILDLFEYNPILFLIALAAPYSFKDWKKVMLLTAIFTLCHAIAIVLSVFGVVIIKGNLTDLLIPITILIVAVFNLFTIGKSIKNASINSILFITLFFGIIDGLSFATNFKLLLVGSPQSKLIPILEFSLGIETSQILVVFIVLILSYIVQTFFRFSKRDWILVLSSFVIGVVLPMIIKSDIWNS
jgi:hypothetical protein